MVSIIIPTHKGSDKVLLPVYSAMTQDYFEKEIIVVDDNGNGTEEQLRTEAVLKPLIQKKKIQYIIHEKNKNGSVARNSGLKVSSGEYINFLDDDDVLLPNKLKFQLEVFKECDESVGAVVCGSYFVHQNGEGFASIPVLNSEHLQRDYLCERSKFNTSAILFKRKAVETIGGFDESFCRHQDWEFCIRMMSKFKFCSCDKILLIKYATNRNIASNPEKAVMFFEHFKNSLGSYFDLLSNEDRKDIYNYHNRRLFRSFLLSKNIVGALKFAKKEKMSIGQIMFTLYEFGILAFKKINRKNVKLVDTYDEYMKKAISAIS